MLYHLDTDFLIYAIGRSGPERQRLLQLSASDVRLQMSTQAWYEFCRGPRPPEQIAAARSFFPDDGILSFTEPIATTASEVFRRLGSPRKRGADIAIGVTAALARAVLLTRNRRDFADIPDLTLEEVS